MILVLSSHSNKKKMVQTSKSDEDVVIKSAVYSRILVFTLIIFFRILASPYDTSASLNPPCLTSNDTHHSRIDSSIQNGVVWDSVYFIRIAQCGYEYEQTYAFLPLLPLSISFFSPTLFSFLPQRSLLAFSAYLINNLAFVLAALYFYRYTFLLFSFFFLLHNFSFVYSVFRLIDVSQLLLLL